MEGVKPIARFAPGEIDGAVKAMREDGALVLNNLWTADTITHLGEIVRQEAPWIDDPATSSVKYRTGKGRYYAPLVLNAAIQRTGVVESAALMSAVAQMLGEDFIYDSLGVIMADAGCPAQDAHSDGGYLFPEAGLDRMLPPTALTLMIPLVDIDEKNGPTEIWPGSHKIMHDDIISDPAPALAARGSAVLWDYRVLHRGSANCSELARPALYATLSRPHWIDHKNFAPGAHRLLVASECGEALGPRFARAHLV